MSDAMTDVLSNLRDHTPTLPSASDAREAVLSHLPSVDIDTSALSKRLRAPSRKGLIAAALGLLTTATALTAYLRHRRIPSQPTSPSMYTPPLPRP